MKKKMVFPKISIVTPCFNSATFLEETILSVLHQNYPNLEYIIIDGGSTDGSVDIIKKYKSKLSYWISEKDNGMYHAIQKGFEKSTGEIMAWINSDDMYHKNAFLIVAEIFSKFNHINWLCGASTLWDEYGRCFNVKLSRRFNRYDFLCGDYQWLQQESCFWRRVLWEKAGSNINSNLKLAGDFELWLRFFRYDKLYVIDSLIGGFRVRSSNQLSLEGQPKYLQEVKQVLNNEPKNKDDRKKLKKYAVFLFIIDILKMLKIFNTEVISKRYKNILFNNTTIYFNRMTQQFDIEKTDKNTIKISE